MKKTLADQMLEKMGEDDTFGVEPDRDLDVDLENAPASSVEAYVLKRIEKKPVQQRVDLYATLISDMKDLIKELPQGERKLILLLKSFKKNNF